MQYNPVGVFQWKDNNKTNKYGSRDYIFLTNVKNNAGERIIVPVYIEATYDYYNVSLGKIKRELDNEVKTVYGKGKIYSYLNNYIKKVIKKRLK